MSGRPREDVAPSGLRAALAAKRVRVEHYPIPVKAQEIIDPLAERLQVARNLAFRASLGDDQAEKAKADAAVVKAKADLDACFWMVGFRGLTSDADFDALVNAHPATDEQKAADPDADMDLDGFRLALLVACCVDGDGMTAEDWRAELWSERWTRADRKALFDRVMLANNRGLSEAINLG